MNDLVDALRTRLKTPYFGYALLAFVALNWRALFLFIVSTASPEDRIAAFDAATGYWSLLISPLLIGAAVAVSTPWIRLIFAFVARKPLELAENLQLEAEHRKTIRQTELEQARGELFAIKETELIERAKRDEQVASITDDGAKNKLARELEELRRERNQLAHASVQETLSDAAVELLRAAASDKHGQILTSRTLAGQAIQAGGRKFGAGGARDFAEYESALAQLIQVKFVKAVGSRDQVFELTHDGWQVAGAL